MCIESARFASDSVALTESEGKYWAGRPAVHLSCIYCLAMKVIAPSEEADVAKVACFVAPVPAEGIPHAGKLVTSGCPMSKRAWKDDSTGNLWQVNRLAPCNLGAVPHSSHNDTMSY